MKNRPYYSHIAMHTSQNSVVIADPSSMISHTYTLDVVGREQAKTLAYRNRKQNLEKPTRFLKVNGIEMY